MRLAAPVQFESYTDGLGIRIVIWNQGCLCNCPGCHNPETHNINDGFEISIAEIKNEIAKHAETHHGVTLSGGDPFLQPEANAEIARFAHERNLNVWAYCGLTFEELLKDKQKMELLKECDVLVDGPFILAQRDITLAFRGSTNQRLIDVQESLKQGKTIIM